MEKKSKIVMVILGVLVLAGIGVIAGCGGGGGSQEPSTPAVVTPTPPVSDGLPPDPGENGKLTLAGVDADADGLRDDIQRYIAISHPDSAKERAALTQYAKVVQSALLDANDKAKSVQHGSEVGQAISCEEYTAGSVEAAIAMEGDLQSVILNTDERNRAYFLYDSQLGGEVFKGTPYDQRASTCTIDPATLPN